MGKKKFIDKKKSATFTLVFRDTAAEDDTAAVPIRQFTRVDGGNSYVPGFTEDDPRSQPGDGDDEDSDHEEDYYDDEDDEEEEEVVKDEEGVRGHGDESRFGDPDESEDEEKESFVQPHQRNKGSKAAVGRRPGSLGRGLAENVRRDLIELGFPDDGYDYNQHMRSIASTGAGAAFVPSTRAADPLRADIRVITVFAFIFLQSAECRNEFLAFIRSFDCHEFQALWPIY